MEGDRGSARVRWCRLLMSFQEGLEGDLVGIECDGAAYFKKVHSRIQENIFFFQILQEGWQKIVKYASLLTLCYHWQSLRKSFLSLKYVVRAREEEKNDNKVKMKGGLGWIRGSIAH